MVWLPKKNWAQKRFSGLASAVAGDAAFRVFCTPSISERRAPNHRQLTERARYHLRNAHWERLATPVGDIQTYIFEPDREIVPGIVLVMHGWTGESSFMTAIAEAIRRSGFRVGLFDFPAHGLSSGRSTNLIDCARATVSVAEQLGPIHALVTHSLGGLIALVAAEGHAPMPGKLSAKHIALIGSPNRLTDVTEHFSRHWTLDDAGRRAFEHRFERIGGRTLDCFAATKLLSASGLRGLVIHAPNDIDVPFRCAKEIVTSVPGMELRAFNGLGHRNILFSAPVARTVTSYLARTVQPAERRAYQPAAGNAPAASVSA